MSSASSHKEADQKSAPTVNETVYNHIKADIISGDLQPNLRLRFENLKERYRVSSSSLREALSRLTADGLVVQESHKGSRVTPMDADDFLDLLSIRKIIETECVTQSVENGDDNWENRLVGAFHGYAKALTKEGLKTISVDERMNRHNAFHTALVSACKSPRMLWMRDLLYAQTERYLSLAFRNIPFDPDYAKQEHEGLMNAALEKNISKLAALVELHLDNTKAILPSIQEFDRAP